MIPRYTHPDMGRIWGDQRKYDTWLRVEVAAAEAMAATGLIPAEAARAIAACDGVRAERVDEIEQTTQHDMIAFTTAVAERVGSSARWLHFGLTSSDVLDTALALQMREACGLILDDLTELLEAIRARAREHRDTPMVGRTHGVHAEPMTFGLKLTLWHTELCRARQRMERARDIVGVGKISGAVGTYAHLEPEIEQRVCAALGLAPAPVSSQVIQRDRHAELLCAIAITGASLEKFALEVRGLQKTEIGEVEEGFAKGQKGSSAMPHKRNPIGCEQLTGLARLLRANAMAALENVALWHERDISHSSVERFIGPDACITLDFALARLTGVVDKLLVYPERMQANMDRMGGLIHSQRVLLALTQNGVSREDAYRLVQRNAMKVWESDGKLMLLDLLKQDEEVTAALSPEQLEEKFDLGYHFKQVDTIFARVFG